MASIKVVLRKKKNKDGSFPLVLRLTKERQTTYIYLAKNILEKEWDDSGYKVRSSNPNSKRLNNYLQNRLAGANNILLELELQQPDFTLQQLKEKIADKKNTDTFFGQVTIYLETLQAAGQWNRLTAEQPAFNHFRRFLKNKDILFHDISVQLLERFKAYLKGGRKVSERTAVNYLILIRTIYSRAIKAGVAKQVYYPFGKDKFRVKRPESQKVGLNKDEVMSLEQLEIDPATYEYEARNRWLFSFYFAGMRASDVLLLRWDDIQSDRLFYVMKKNDKPLSLKIPDKALAILKQYRLLKEQGNELVFPDLNNVTDFGDKITVQKKIKYRISKINDGLKRIAKRMELTKPLTMHIARHSFATISGDRIPVQKLQQLYRHSSIQTTIGYQKAFMYKSADDALDTVLDW